MIFKVESLSHMAGIDMSFHGHCPFFGFKIGDTRGSNCYHVIQQVIKGPLTKLGVAPGSDGI